MQNFFDALSPMQRFMLLPLKSVILMLAVIGIFCFVCKAYTRTFRVDYNQASPIVVVIDSIRDFFFIIALLTAVYFAGRSSYGASFDLNPAFPSAMFYFGISSLMTLIIYALIAFIVIKRILKLQKWIAINAPYKE